MPRTYGVDGEPAVAFVTGAARGIGRASAIALAEEGVTVAVADRDEVECKDTLEAITALGVPGMFLSIDVGDEQSCSDAIDAVVAEFGHLDCAVNAAGIVGHTSGLEGSDWNADMFDEVIRVNLRGVALCVKHELRHMVPRGSGSIVTIASGAGMIGVPGAPAYTASKHGALGVTRSAALEHARSGVRINAVCPGAVRTRMLAGAEDFQAAAHPIGRLADPSEIAGAVRWLCSSDSTYVLGAAIAVDGGYTAQ